MEITFHQDLGPKQYQEDRFFARTIEHQCTILAVFDGHGYFGHEIPEACIKYLEGLDFQNEINEDLMRDIVADLQILARKEAGGSTATICIIADKAYIAVIGDSPIWVMDKTGKVHDFRTHNCTDPKNEDVKTIRERGGVIEYLGRGMYLKTNGSYLAMTRALGDMDHNKFLVREPDIYTVDNPISVVVCSDGFTCGTKKVEEFLHGGKKAKDLFEYEQFLGLTDNFTSVVWYQ